MSAVKRVAFSLMILALAGCGTSATTSGFDGGPDAGSCPNLYQMACLDITDAGCSELDIQCCGGTPTCTAGGELMSRDAITTAGGCVSLNFGEPCPR